MMPEPTTVATSSSVPSASATSRRDGETSARSCRQAPDHQGGRCRAQTCGLPRRQDLGRRFIAGDRTKAERLKEGGGCFCQQIGGSGAFPLCLIEQAKGDRMAEAKALLIGQHDNGTQEYSLAIEFQPAEADRLAAT